MARVQYGTIVTEIKGKNQGHVFQGGNVGFVLRSKGYTKGISSFQRKSANTILATNASTWRTLTDAQRAQWNALAPDWLFYNKFGASYQGSGFQIFVSYNNALLGLLETPVSVPGAVDSPVTIAPLTLIYSLAGGFALDHNDAGTANDFLIIFASAPVSAGRNTNHPRLKKLGFFTYNGVDETILTSEYVATFGTPRIGQRIIVQVYAIRDSFPYPFYRTNISTLVVA